MGDPGPTTETGANGNRPKPARRLIILIGAIVLIGAGVHRQVGLGAGQSKPTTHNTLFTDGRVVPPTLETLWAQADAVARIIVDDGRPDDAFAPGVTVPLVATVYDASVLEALKSDTRIAPGSLASVWRIGGVRDKGDHVEYTDEDDFPLFRTGEEYVVFLKWKDWRNAYEIIGGPNGAFRLTDGRIASSGTSTLAKQQNGLKASDFLEKLRALIVRLRPS